MTQSSNPLVPNSGDDSLPDDSPEALRRIAERLQIALEDSFAVTEDAEPIARADCDFPREVGDDCVDRRLYVPFSEGWEVRIKTGPRDYCFFRQPGENGFHLILTGELYLQYGSQKMCLSCAYRQGFITDDRLFWQTGHRRAVPPKAEIDTNEQSAGTR